MDNNEKLLNGDFKSYRMSPDAWNKILEAAREEPLPVLAAVVWGLGKILDDRLNEVIIEQKFMRAALKDIRCELDAANKIFAEQQGDPAPEQQGDPDPEHQGDPDPEHQGDPDPEHQGDPDPKQQGDPDPKQPDDPEQETPAQIIQRHLGRYKMQARLGSRQQVIDFAQHWKHWVLKDLAKTFGCKVSEVPAKVADYLGFTVETPETSQTESADEEKTGEN